LARQADLHDTHSLVESVGRSQAIQVDDSDHGAREYSAADPEGNLWHFGTYRPQAPQ
jgi:uncharacterized glyoxalase superfamily protein PhnB